MTCKDPRMPLLRRTAALALAGWLAAGCQAVFTGLYGIREPRRLAPAELPAVAAEYGIPPAVPSAALDTSFLRVLRRLDKSDSAASKNHAQFLQAVYYDAAGRQQSLHTNCYAGGFPNLTWTRDGILSQFPPAQQAPRDTLLTLAEHLGCLRPALPPLPPADYTVVVHWSRFMTRQSRRLIAAVRQNVALAPPGTRVAVVYVNNDSFYHQIYQWEDEWVAREEKQKAR